MMIEKLTAILLALVLSLGAVTAVQAQGNDTNTNVTEPVVNVTEPVNGNVTEPVTNVTEPELTSIQIAAFDSIQRGQKQYVTVVGFDEVGSEMNDTSFRVLRVLESGRSLGPLVAQSGEALSFRVGGNTAPQTITLIATSAGSDINGTMTYDVYAKGNAPTPDVNVTEPVANTTTSFEQLQNSTAILEQEIDEVDNGGNETDRADLKTAVGETLSAFGGVASEVNTATNDQLETIKGTAESVVEAIDQVLG